MRGVDCLDVGLGGDHGLLLDVGFTADFRCGLGAIGLTVAVRAVDDVCATDSVSRVVVASVVHYYPFI